MHQVIFFLGQKPQAFIIIRAKNMKISIIFILTSLILSCSTGEKWSRNEASIFVDNCTHMEMQEKTSSTKKAAKKYCQCLLDYLQDQYPKKYSIENRDQVAVELKNNGVMQDCRE